MLDRPFDAKTWQSYEQIVIKLTDFGFCRSAYEPYRGTLFRRVQHPFDFICCGTLPYSSPELLKKYYYNPLTNDLWALGVMLYEMLSGRLPFDAMDKKNILLQQLKGVSFQHVTLQEHEAVARCDHRDPAVQCRGALRPARRPVAPVRLREVRQLSTFATRRLVGELRHRVRTALRTPLRGSLQVCVDNIT